MIEKLYIFLNLFYGALSNEIMLASFQLNTYPSYGSDMMSSESWELQTHQYSWIAEYYKKEEILQDFLVLCKEESCQKIYRYVKYPWQFRKHMREMHQDVYDYEGQDVEHENWKYCTRTKNGDSTCIFCHKSLSEFSSPNTFLKMHVIYVHQENLEFYKKQDWIWKYLIPVEDFSGKCYLCEDEAHIVELDLNILNLKKHIVEEHEKECQISSSTLNEKFNWKYATEKYNWLEKCYINLGVNFLAQCIFCTQNKKLIQYMRFTNLREHMTKKHIFVYINEMTNFNEFISVYWSCFRYTKSEIQEEIECISCDEILQNLNSTEEKERKMRNHISKYGELCFFPKLQNRLLKYINQDEDCAICVICEENRPCSFYIQNLKEHMKNMHKKDWDRIQKESEQGEAHAQAGP